MLAPQRLSFPKHFPGAPEDIELPQMQSDPLLRRRWQVAGLLPLHLESLPSQVPVTSAPVCFSHWQSEPSLRRRKHLVWLLSLQRESLPTQSPTAVLNCLVLVSAVVVIVVEAVTLVVPAKRVLEVAWRMVVTRLLVVLLLCDDDALTSSRRIKASKNIHKCVDIIGTLQSMTPDTGAANVG